MGPFLINTFVIKSRLAQGARLDSPKELRVPYKLLGRALALISHQGAGVQDVYLQGATCSQAPSARKSRAAASKEKATRTAASNQRRTRAS